MEELQAQLETGQGVLEELEAAPYRRTIETVCMFCDVSGFTKLSEQMANNGMGAEGLAKYLNKYFAQMSKKIQGEGGDIFKYAGDAMIVLWPDKEDEDGKLLHPPPPRTSAAPATPAAQPAAARCHHAAYPSLITPWIACPSLQASAIRLKIGSAVRAKPRCQSRRSKTLWIWGRVFSCR